MVNQVIGFKIAKIGRHLVSGTMSALAFGVALTATSAHATSYFTDVTATDGTLAETIDPVSGDGIAHDGGGTLDNYLQRYNVVTSGDVTQNRVNTLSITDDAVFDPTSVLTSYYTDAALTGGANTDSNTYSLTSSSAIDLPVLTLTFDNGASANDIYKVDATVFSTRFTSVTSNQEVFVSLDGVNEDGGARLYNEVSSSAYTANLVFNGVNTVSGSTDIDDGNIAINGSVNFAGSVVAGDVVVDSTQAVNFNSHLNLEAGLDTTASETNTLLFTKAGDVTLNADFKGLIDFDGYDATITLNDSNVYSGVMSGTAGSIDTSTAGTGTLVLGGAANIYANIGETASLKEIRLESTDYNYVAGTTAANLVNITSAGTLGFVGGLDTRLSDGATLGSVDFNNFNATVQVGNGTTPTNSQLFGNVTTDSDGNGVLTMIAGVQEINGQIGEDGKAIQTLNIGATATGTGYLNDNLASDTTVSGDVYAKSTVLNSDDTNTTSNGSILRMASGYDLNSTVTTEIDGTGELYMLGGMQTVTGDVGENLARLATVNSGGTGATTNFGTSSATANVYAVTVNNTGTGTSNFSNNVVATTINVNDGISNFTNDVTATTTNIGAGTGNFNTNESGSTASHITFTDAGTANLYTGLTGDINFAGHNATVNVWDNEVVDGRISTTDNNTGIVNFKGDGTHNGNIGATTLGVASLNVDTNNVQLSQQGVLVNGSVYADAVSLNGGTLTIAVGEDMADTGTGSFITTVASPEGGSGELRLLGGDQVVDGVVGADNARLSYVQTSFEQSGSTTFTDTVYIDRLENGGDFAGNAVVGEITLDGMAYINMLNMNTPGAVVNLNGTNADSAVSGMVGQLALNTKDSTVNIGDNVNLTVIDLLSGGEGVAFTYAEEASLNFVGSSVVNGQLGGGMEAANSTFATIHAGANGETVTFKDDVYVVEGTVAQPTTFHVSGTGTVNFEGNLTGDLVFDADGVVNVSADKSIVLSDTAEVLAATAVVDGEGTMNFLGTTTLASDLGEQDTNLKAVNFNTASNNVTQTIASNVFADDVTIGNVTEEPTAKALTDVTGTYDYAGATQMSVFTQGQTIINPEGDITFGGDVTFANSETAMNVGTSHIDVAGVVTTNDAGLSFTVNTLDVTGADDASSTSTGSGQITATSLVMDGDESIHVNYVGSLANAGSYVLIDTTTNEESSYSHDEGLLVSDNSFSIDTRVEQVNGGDLVVYADRTGDASYAAEDNYNQKANLVGDISNGAGSALGAIAAAGSQEDDMVEVIQKLEIDSFGYGNTSENLATQVKRLAPIANDSMLKSTMVVSSMPVRTVETRMADLRSSAQGMSAGDEMLERAAWFKLLGATGEQDSTTGYDGYKYNSFGLMVGADTQIDDKLVLGAAMSATQTNIDQQDFREGDTTDLDAYQLTGYGAYDLTKNIYLEGALTFGQLNYDGQRQTAIDRVALADYSGNQLGLNLTAGYSIALSGKQMLTPMFKLNYNRVKNDAYTETDAGAISLNVEEQSVNQTRWGLGVKYQNEFMRDGKTYMPELSVAYTTVINPDDSTSIEASYVGGGDSFTTPVALVEDDTLNVGAGLTIESGDNSSVNLRYDLESRDGFIGQSAELTARWLF